MVKIVINADDYGLSNGICKSIHELLRAGAISSTTIMIGADGARERCVAHNVRAVARRVGVHLHVTGGRPISPVSDVPSLVDASSGRFLPKDQIAAMNPAEVEVEWSRQIELVADILGRLPSHLDTHHGAHRIPSLTPVYFRLAQRYKVPVRGGTELGQFASWGEEVARSTLAINQWTGRGLDCDKLKEMIIKYVAMLNADEVLEVVTHPGYCDDLLRSISSLNVERENDHRVLMQLATEDWLESHGHELVRFPSFEPAVGPL